MGLRVIGAGFGRTGTASLKLALEQIGFGPCYHMSEVLQNPTHIQKWLDVAAGRPDWKGIFDGYQACVDFPSCSFYQELAATYPGAKVVLSVRDPEAWFDSIHATIMSPGLVEHVSGSPFGELSRRIIWDRFGGKIHDRAHMVKCFNAHTESVKAAIDPDRLLVYQVKQGWGPLCDFLGAAPPATAFPHVNSTEDTQRLFADIFAQRGDAPIGAEFDRVAKGLFKEASSPAPSARNP
ncbi:MAG: sulfotransferase family protein [Phycisphaerales bacterium JB041]